MNRLTAFIVSALLAGGALAQAYPSRPVKVIVPWPPGQATDIAARMLAQKLQETMGQPFIIDNRPGAGGSLGVARGGSGTSTGAASIAGCVSAGAMAGGGGVSTIAAALASTASGAAGSMTWGLSGCGAEAARAGLAARGAVASQHDAHGTFVVRRRCDGNADIAVLGAQRDIRQAYRI
jgi:hypothetical protein